MARGRKAKRVIRCKARLRDTGQQCKGFTKSGSAWCVSHQDPASRWDPASGTTAAAADGIPHLPRLVDDAAAKPETSLFLESIDRKLDTIIKQTGPIDTVEVTFNGVDVRLEHGPHGWSCVTEPPHQSKDQQHTDANHAVLLGSALAQSMQDGFVKPSDAERIARDIQYSINGEQDWQYHFEKQSLYTLNLYSAALTAQWERAGDPPAAVPALATAAPPAQDLQRSDS